jgi:hypothetical protein
MSIARVNANIESHPIRQESPTTASEMASKGSKDAIDIPADPS